MREEFITFENQGQKLYGMLHLPEGAGPHPAFILLHGYTATRIGPHRIFVKCAREAAARGFAALRFDFRGSGESEGGFEQMTISAEVSDAARALDLLELRPEVDPARLGVLGLSMGGAVASLLLGQDSRPRSAVLWAPLADPYAIFLAGAGGRLPETDYDNHGDLVGRAFSAELPSLDLLGAIRRYQGPLLVIHGDMDQTVPYQLGVRLYDAAPGRKSLEIIPGAGHTFDSVPWERRVLDLTLDWWEATL